MSETRTAPYFLTVLARSRPSDETSEIRLETKECLTLEQASDDFALYCEIYGTDCAVVVHDPVGNTARYFSFPSLRWATNPRVRSGYTPYVGLAVTECFANDTYGRVVAGVRLNGREIEIANDLKDEAVKAFTLRQDGVYRAKGSTSTPYLVLGVHETYRNPDI